MPHRLGPVGRSVQGLNARQRAREIARALADQHNKRGVATATTMWETAGLAVKIRNVREESGDLVMEVDVNDAASGQSVPFNNPLIIRNPRLLVPTAESETVIDEFGKAEQRVIFEENLTEALRLMVLNTVRIVCQP